MDGAEGTDFYKVRSAYHWALGRCGSSGGSSGEWLDERDSLAGPGSWRAPVLQVRPLMRRECGLNGFWGLGPGRQAI